MPEIQKSNIDYVFDKIENLLEEKKKTKRALAKALGISENSINRSLKNPKVAFDKLETVAHFLELDIFDLLSRKKISTLQEIDTGYMHTNSLDNMNQLTISSLSTSLERSTKTVDKLVQIIYDNFPDKKNLVENIR